MRNHGLVRGTGNTACSAPYVVTSLKELEAARQETWEKSVNRRRDDGFGFIAAGSVKVIVPSFQEKRALALRSLYGEDAGELFHI